MSWAWVTRPGEEARLPEVAEVASRLQAEIAAIEALGNETSCRICGVEGPLTEEHAPSKRAGNRGPLIRGSVDHERSVASGQLTWTAETIQAAVYPTLCGTCNNHTGAWYNPAYVRLADHCTALAIPENAGRACDVEVEVHPQRVAKQALASILAVSQPGVTERYPHLRELIVGKENAGPIAPVRLGLYLRANCGGRTSGLATSIDLGRRVGRIIAEFSFSPLGWFVSFDGSELDGIVDVSSWTEIGYHDEGVVKLAVPCQTSR